MSAHPPQTSQSADEGGFVIAALYEFRRLDGPTETRDRLRTFARHWSLTGTLIVAGEGINGTVAGTREAIDALATELRRMGFAGLEYKESHAAAQPFRKLKVRLKREIVSLGVDVDPAGEAGRKVGPAEWNALIDAGEAIVIDTRNRYEVEAGTFRGALNPGLEAFTEFPRWAAEHLAGQEDRPIAMFCTGGIRCEKSTSLLTQLGFSDVVHLDGGILNYLEQTPQAESRWEGECFVFDSRVTVGHAMEPGSCAICHGCGWPLTPDDLGDSRYERGVSCRFCFETTSADRKAAFRDRQRHFDRQALVWLPVELLDPNACELVRSETPTGDSQ